MGVALRSIGDAMRRTVLDALREGPRTQDEPAERVPIARPGVARHLRVLREAGFMEVEARDRFRVCSLRAEPLIELDDHRALRCERLDALRVEIARGARARRDTL